MSDAWQVPGPPINRGRRPTPDPCGTVAWKVHCPRPWPMRRRASATTALLVHHDTRWPLARSRHPLNRSGPAGGGGSRRNDVFSRQERLVAGTRDPASPGGHLAAPLAPGDKRRSPGGAGEPGSRGAGEQGTAFQAMRPPSRMLIRSGQKSTCPLVPTQELRHSRRVQWPFAASLRANWR